MWIDPEKGAATKKVIVIGKGRFGTAAAQGLRESFIKDEKGFQLPAQVLHFSAASFTSLEISVMAEQLQGSTFVVYCGTRLPEYATKIANAMKEARDSSTSEMEFIDFSNPGKLNSCTSK